MASIRSLGRIPLSPLYHSAQVKVVRTTPSLAFSLPRPNSVKLGSALSSSVTPEMSAAVKKEVDEYISQNRVMVFSKSWCSFSRRAKMTLAPLAKDMKVWEIDETDSESLIQSYLRTITGSSTVPQIFIHGKFIGGNSDLKQIPMPQLKKLINDGPAQ